MAKPAQLRSIYQLKVQLTGLRPPVWRRLLVSSTATLEELHHTLQISMGWTNSHLHQFIVQKRRYGLVDPDLGMDWDNDLLDESDFKVQDVLKAEGDSIAYEYDFGDGWLHKVGLEKVLPFKLGQPLPYCVKGKRACPPEDVGGVPGYMDFVEKWLDPNHPEHADLVEWAGDFYGGPEYFSLDEANEFLTEFFSDLFQ